MNDEALPLAKIMRIVVALVVGGIGLWAYLSKKGKEEAEAFKRKQEDDRKAAEANAAELKRQREEGLRE